MKEERAIKVKSEQIGEITLSICKSYILWDVVAEGKVKDLKKLKRKLGLDSKIFKEGVFGEPIIVVDTADSKKDIEYLFKETKKRLYD